MHSTNPFSVGRAMRATIFAVLLAGGSSAAAEQLTEGQAEVLGFVGAATDNLGGTFGGGLQYAIRRRWLAAGEVGYLTAQQRSHGLTVDVNAHYLVPTRDARFTPYLLGGLGILRVGARGASNTEGGLNLGGGARIGGGANWGLRPEIKFWIGDGTYARFSVGVYHQFGN